MTLTYLFRKSAMYAVIVYVPDAKAWVRVLSGVSRFDALEEQVWYVKRGFQVRVIQMVEMR